MPVREMTSGAGVSARAGEAFSFLGTGQISCAIGPVRGAWEGYEGDDMVSVGECDGVRWADVVEGEGILWVCVM
jgi:hypothetical protein